MKTFANSFFKKALCVAMCVISLFALSLSLCGCSQDVLDEEQSYIERELYFQSAAFFEDGTTLVAYVGFSGDDNQKIEGTTAGWLSTSGVYNVWYNQSNTLISICPSTIFSAVDALIPQEERILDGIEYSVLKVYLKYDTIYKSIKSDAQSVVKKGKTYTHLFDIESDVASQSYTLHLKQQNSASWYSVLISACIVVCALAVGLYLSIKGGLWRNKKTK